MRGRKLQPLSWKERAHQTLCTVYHTFARVAFKTCFKTRKARDLVKDKDGKPKSMEKLGKEIGRGSKIIFTHINMHNNMVHAV